MVVLWSIIWSTELHVFKFHNAWHCMYNFCLGCLTTTIWNIWQIAFPNESRLILATLNHQHVRDHVVQQWKFISELFSIFTLAQTRLYSSYNHRHSKVFLDRRALWQCLVKHDSSRDGGLGACPHRKFLRTNLLELILGEILDSDCSIRVFSIFWPYILKHY